MDIEKIKRRRDRKIKINNWWHHTVVSPLDDFLYNIKNSKYEKNKMKAEKLTDEEAINIIVKGIIKKIKATGRYDEEIVVCSKFNESSYRELGIYNFIGRTNQYWLENDIMRIWYWNNSGCNDINRIQKLANLLVEGLRKKIKGIKIERVKEKHCCELWVYEDYKETIKISI